MDNPQTGSFQEALDVIESLPEYQQEDIIKIIKNRLIEKRRDTIAENIREAREEYRTGKIKKGSVNDLMKVTTQVLSSKVPGSGSNDMKIH